MDCFFLAASCTSCSIVLVLLLVFGWPESGSSDEDDNGWLAWSHERGIDYFIGRTLAPRLASFGLTRISGTAETAIYNGGSLWADYWIETITELRVDLISSGKLDQALIDQFLACCADSNWWTQTIAFTAVHGLTRGA